MDSPKVGLLLYPRRGRLVAPAKSFPLKAIVCLARLSRSRSQAKAKAEAEAAPARVERARLPCGQPHGRISRRCSSRLSRVGAAVAVAKVIMTKRQGWKFRELSLKSRSIRGSRRRRPPSAPAPALRPRWLLLLLLLGAENFSCCCSVARSLACFGGCKLQTTSRLLRNARPHAPR